MGYYTLYDVSCNSDDVDLDNVLSEVSDYTFYQGELEGKWYEHEDEMKTLSRLIPDVLFTVHGKGEESGDVWYKYFKNGKMQVCKAKITFAPYDESKLA